MKLVLKRKIKTSKTTIGELYLDGNFVCYTLEDIDRNLTATMSDTEIKSVKVYGRTAIPRGTYTLKAQISPSNKKRYFYLQNVKGYAGVRIEWGNYANDTKGCILVGNDYQTDSISGSVAAYNTLIAQLNKSKTAITITIQDDDNTNGSQIVTYLIAGIVCLGILVFMYKKQITTFLEQHNFIKKNEKKDEGLPQVQGSD
jgi:hypothetical protein